VASLNNSSLGHSAPSPMFPFFNVVVIMISIEGSVEVTR